MLYGQNLRDQSEDFRRTAVPRRARRNNPGLRRWRERTARATENSRARARANETRLHEPSNPSCADSRPRPRRRRPRLGVAIATRQTRSPAEPQLPDHRRAARHGASSAAEAGVPLSEITPNAPDIYTVKTPRHALGHLEHVPEEPVALARALGHEPGAGAKPAPDLPRPGAVPRQVGRPRPPAHGRAGRRRRHGDGKLSAARARQATSPSTASPRSRST